MGKTKKGHRGARRRSSSSSSSSSTSSSSSSSSCSVRSRGHRRSRSGYANRYCERRPDKRMLSMYQPGYGGMPMGNGYPMQNGMVPNGMMPQMPSGMMSQMPSGMMPHYGPAIPQPNMMQPMQPPMYPYQNGMVNWPYQGVQLNQPQMQPPAAPTPVFQFQISPGKSVPGKK